MSPTPRGLRSLAERVNAARQPGRRIRLTRTSRRFSAVGAGLRAEEILAIERDGARTGEA